MDQFQRLEDEIPNNNAIITAYINYHIRFHTIQLFKKTGSTTFAPESTGVLPENPLSIRLFLNTKSIPTYYPHH